MRRWKEFAQREAVVDGEHRLSYAQLERCSGWVAQQVRKHGMVRNGLWR